jgi:hypothetical protein
MSSLKATVAQVKIGPFSLEGLMDEQGEYYVGIPQLASIELVPPNLSAKRLESFVGKGFPSGNFVKLKTPLNSKEINAVSLELFSSLLFELSLKGNKKAIEISRALVGLSLYQLFCDSFKVKCEEEDRQRWLETRFKTKHDFRPLTDQLKAHGFLEPWEYAKFVSQMQAKISVENGTRDFLDFSTLHKLERCQTILTAYMDCGLSPYEALNRINPDRI